MRDRTDFLAAAVAEAQSTIRAIDVKVSALLVAALVPIPLLGGIIPCLANIYNRWPLLPVGAAISALAVAWALAVYCYVRAISAIDSPAQHVLSGSDRSGALYSPALYSLGWLDALFNRAGVQSKVDTLAHLLTFPVDQAAIEKELAFEHLKLAYIRDVKLTRLKWGVRLSAVAVTLGTALYAVGRYHLAQCGP